jgi:hypothetical protein
VALLSQAWSPVTNMRSALFWCITQRRMVILDRRFGTSYPSLLQGSRSPRRNESRKVDVRYVYVRGRNAEVVSSMTTKTQMVLETVGCSPFNYLTWLLAREFSRRESFKLWCTVFFFVGITPLFHIRKIPVWNLSPVPYLILPIKCLCRCNPENSRVACVSNTVPFPSWYPLPVLWFWLWYCSVRTLFGCLSRSVSLAWRRGLGSFEFMYSFFHDANPNIALVLNCDW